MAGFSIRLRLILSLGLVLSLALLSTIAALLIDAGPRLHNEIESSMRVTHSVLVTSLGAIAESGSPPESLARLVDGLAHQRHVRVGLQSRGGREAMFSADNGARGVVLPNWLDGEQSPVVEIPVVIGGHTIDTVILAAAGSDEMAEVWDTIARIALYGTFFALGAFAITSWLVKISLSPIDRLASAMHHLEDGDYDVAVPVQGPPEIATICRQLNTLASALSRSRDENRRLSVAIVKAQDDERREVARELHDELGPHLFLLRATGNSLLSTLVREPQNVGRVEADARQMLAKADLLQKTNRRVLQKLSPVGLKELGLVGALEALVAGWRADQPDIEMALDISAPLTGLDDTVSLTIYRIIQEGVTNAFRHAGATRIAVSIGYRQQNAKTLAIRVDDNGGGVEEAGQEGFGLTGMRERVAALGGSLEISSLPAGGTRLEGLLPCPDGQVRP